MHRMLSFVPYLKAAGVELEFKWYSLQNHKPPYQEEGHMGMVSKQ